MYVIAGLGNPKKDYKNTRHNIGFDVIDIIAKQYNISSEYKKHRAVCSKGYIDGHKVILAKPQTFMNLSGESIIELVKYYNIEPSKEMIVIFDDVSLDVGQLRIRKKGSAGGHNGMKSIISSLGSTEFQRIKMGVGEKPKGYDLADYVLGHFTKSERILMDDAALQVAEAVKMMIAGEIDAAMNLFNKKAELNKLIGEK